MDINTIFSKKAILEIVFLNRDDFYNISFLNNDYLIVGRDRDIDDNVIGISKNGEVYYLTLDSSDVCYIAKDIDTFAAELLLFERFIKTKSPVLNDDQHESQLSVFADSFRNELLKLDKSVFRNDEEDTFWSEVCDEIEYGILL